jgi:ABC-type sugar transport system ATPase subunit
LPPAVSGDALKVGEYNTAEGTFMALVRLENISKSFPGKKKVLKDVSLEIADKSVTSLLAPTGYGKTTLLRIIAGVEKPDHGRVYFGGKDVTDLPTQKQNVAMVFQSFALYPNMTVYDNIASPLRLRGLSRESVDEKVRRQADSLGIRSLLGKHPHELSGGERQRVAIGRALVKGADVFLLDEPLTNLDYKIRESMRMELKNIFKEIEGTIVYATPDPREVLAISTHVALIQNGTIGQYGSAVEVYNKPKNIEAGTYFGYPPMNLIECRMEEKEGGLRLRLFEELDLDVTHLEELFGEERSCVGGLRPNDLRLDNGEAGGTLSFSPRVLLCEVIGSETIVYLEYKNQELQMLVPKIVGREGETVRVSFNPENLYIYGKGSGRLITKYTRR